MPVDGILLEYIMGGGVLTIALFSIGTYVKVGKIKDEVNSKITRVYGRLDEVKDSSDQKFVNRDICKILHNQTAEDIIDIKSDLKLLLRQNGLGK